MWLASLPIQHGIFKSFYAVAPQNVPRRFEINAFAYGLGHLVIQVSTCRWTNKRNRRFEPPPHLTQGWSGIRFQLSPSQSSAAQFIGLRERIWGVNSSINTRNGGRKWCQDG